MFLRTFEHSFNLKTVNFLFLFRISIGAFITLCVTAVFARSPKRWRFKNFTFITNEYASYLVFINRQFVLLRAFQVFTASIFYLIFKILFIFWKLRLKIFNLRYFFTQFLWLFLALMWIYVLFINLRLTDFTFKYIILTLFEMRISWITFLPAIK